MVDRFKLVGKPPGRGESHELTNWIIEIWPAPEGHHSGFTHEIVSRTQRVDIEELLTARVLESGTSLFPRRKKFASSVATLLSGGRLDIQGVIYSSPSEAAKSITGTATNGWSFFLIDPQTKRSLGDVRREYRESRYIEGEDEDDDADDDT